MGLTNWPNGVSSFGIPQLGDGIPSTYGEYIFVDPDSTGADNGKTMKNAFRTVGQAVDAAATNTNAVILMNANSAHSTSSPNDELTLTKSRIHFVGLGGGSRYFGQRTRWTMGVTTGTAIAVVQNTGVGNTFTNIKFDSADTLATSLFAFAEGGEFTQMTNCEIVKSTDLDQVTSGVLLANGDSAYYLRCMIGSLVHQVTVNRPDVKFNRETISGKVARDNVFEDVLFLLNTTATASALLHGTGATDIERMLLLKNCTYLNAVLSSADPDQAIEFDAAQTQGAVIVQGGMEQGCTALSTTTGVFVNGPTPDATSVSSIQAS